MLINTAKGGVCGGQRCLMGDLSKSQKTLIWEQQIILLGKVHGRLQSVLCAANPVDLQRNEVLCDQKTHPVFLLVRQFHVL